MIPESVGKQLYAAKCKDLEILYKPDQEQRFLKSLQLTCKPNKLCLTDQGIGKFTTKAAMKVCINSIFTTIDFSKNPLGQPGVSEICSTIRNCMQIVHLDLTSVCMNDKAAV